MASCGVIIIGYIMYEHLPLFYVLMNLWYRRIASWDIRVLVFFCPESAPLSLICNITILARYPTDDWHLANMFSYVYFSVIVCLRVLYHIIIFLAPGQDIVSVLTPPPPLPTSTHPHTLYLTLSYHYRHQIGSRNCLSFLKLGQRYETTVCALCAFCSHGL